MPQPCTSVAGNVLPGCAKKRMQVMVGFLHKSLAQWMQSRIKEMSDEWVLEMMEDGDGGLQLWKAHSQRSTCPLLGDVKGIIIFL